MRKNIIFCSLSKQREIAEAGGYSWMFWIRSVWLGVCTTQTTTKELAHAMGRAADTLTWPVPAPAGGAGCPVGAHGDAHLQALFLCCVIKPEFWKLNF